MVDWLSQGGRPDAKARIGVFGYGEGGAIALYAAALDPRIDAVCVSGYFDDRNDIWTQPIDRNVFGLLEQFGDAELASLVAPRPLDRRGGAGPRVRHPPGRAAAPGKLDHPELETVKAEVDRAGKLVAGLDAEPEHRAGRQRPGRHRAVRHRRGPAASCSRRSLRTPSSTRPAAVETARASGVDLAGELDRPPGPPAPRARPPQPAAPGREPVRPRRSSWRSSTRTRSRPTRRPSSRTARSSPRGHRPVRPEPLAARTSARGKVYDEPK